MRQIILDTETTGLDAAGGHRIIEIGCIELLNRRQSGNNFHVYLNPEREVDAAAAEVHGLTNEMLADKPRFAEVVADLLRYLGSAELIIHNASFDVGFLNAELRRLDSNDAGVESRCNVIDSLPLARQLHPGQKNSLDALCKRYRVDNSKREFHGALLDAQLLAEVYLAMTGGQSALGLDQAQSSGITAGGRLQELLAGRRPRVQLPDEAEKAVHTARLQALQKTSGERCLWLSDESASA